MKPEEKARQKIDRMLEAAGWTVQDVQELNLSASFGVAVREFPMENGAADYLLSADRTALGVVEAKPEGTTLSSVADQSGKYTETVPESLPHVKGPLPLLSAKAMSLSRFPRPLTIDSMAGWKNRRNWGERLHPNRWSGLLW
ncbi:MAG: hypothetical protein U9N36_01080 [Euryarchaeota archaeon]|nr:hypothetical protein [Euryarchaeota archaeon]